MATPQQIPENITQELYKRNVELAVKNKTLSLLSKLYEISILTLEPASLAERITQTIQTELDFDLVGMLHYDDAIDALTPLHVARSQRLGKVFGETNELLHISKASRHAFFGTILTELGSTYTEDLAELWDDLALKEKLETAQKEAHLRTILFYPLITGDKNILGILMIGINRAYGDLSEFERESIHNVVNVIAIAYGKALLYQELEITNRKLADANSELKRLDQTKTEFMSIASHQLRAPLTVIKGYLSLAIEGTLGALPQQAKDSLGKAAYSTEQLVKLMNELLNLSRMEAGKIEYTMSKNSLTLTIKEVMDELKTEAEKKKLTLVLEPKEALEQCLFDPDKMREVIMNLVHNAVKYSPNGKILVRQEIVSHDAGKFVRVSVQDNGIGIAKEDIHRLFAKFIRSAEAKKVDVAGLGLGLFFVKKVVEDHGGKAWAESEGLGKGSTFIIEIPFKE